MLRTPPAGIADLFSGIATKTEWRLRLSEFITHTIHADDCVSLVHFHNAFEPAVVEALTTYIADVRSCAGVRGGRFVYPVVLKRIRESGGTPSSQRDARHLAAAFGTLSHRAADRYFKPRYAELNADWYAHEDVLPYPSMIRLLHDVVLIKERRSLRSNQNDIRFHPAIFDYSLKDDNVGALLDIPLLERLWGAKIQSDLIGLRDFPDPSAPEEWLQAYFENLEPIYINLSRYADAYSTPSAEDYRRFVYEPNFYDRTDPIIRLATSRQGGAAAVDVDIEPALADQARQSQWAQALALGMTYYEAAQQYLRREIEQETFLEVLETRNAA